MEIAEILTPQRVINNAEVSSKKTALETLAGMISSAIPDITQTEVCESLIAREKLGSTGLGHGIALPHGRRKGGTHTIGAFMRLQTAVQYDSIDQKPVDILFALLVPEESTEEHLQILSKLAAIFSENTLVNDIRNCDSSEAVFEILARQ